MHDAISQAIAHADLDAAAALLDAGADPNGLASVLPPGYTPWIVADEVPLLVSAALTGSVAVVDLLLRHGARVDQPVRHEKYYQTHDDSYWEAGGTALCFAAKFGTLAVVEHLLHAGADVDLTDDCNNSPLALAATWGKPEVAARLLAAGADLHTHNGDAMDARGLAEREGYPEIAALIDAERAARRAT